MVLTSQSNSNKQYLQVAPQIRLYKWNIFCCFAAYQETIELVYMMNCFNAVYRTAVAGKGISLSYLKPGRIFGANNGTELICWFRSGDYVNVGLVASVKIA